MSVLPSGDISAPEPEPMREQRIERLVSEISQVLRGARGEFRQMASDLLDDPPLNLQ